MKRSAWNYIDLTGNKYGRLTVEGLSYIKTTLRGKRLPYWKCICECGKVKDIWGGSLRHGVSKSCGCWRAEQLGAVARKHGMSHHPAYRLWTEMRGRCENENNDTYESYGGRGIKVCKRWNSFPNFITDMGDRPRGHSMDRIDVNGNYEPSNCRWADAITQANNKRRTKRIEFMGRFLTIAEWSRETGIKQSVISLRLGRLGWPPSRA